MILLQFLSEIRVFLGFFLESFSKKVGGLGCCIPQQGQLILGSVCWLLVGVCEFVEWDFWFVLLVGVF